MTMLLNRGSLILSGEYSRDNTCTPYRILCSLNISEISEACSKSHRTSRYTIWGMLGRGKSSSGIEWWTRKSPWTSSPLNRLGRWSEGFFGEMTPSHHPTVAAKFGRAHVNCWCRCWLYISFTVTPRESSLNQHQIWIKWTRPRCLNV